MNENAGRVFTHFRWVNSRSVDSLHLALIEVIAGQLPLVVQAANGVEASEHYGGTRSLHHAGKPTIAKRLGVMVGAGASADCAGAVAESHLRNKNAVRVDDVHVAHSAYGVRTNIRAVAKIHHQSNVGQCRLQPKVLVPALRKKEDK